MATRTVEAAAGRVTTAGDPDSDSRRAIFNAMIDRRPLESHVCAGLADIVAAVRRARELEAPISSRGGGHSVAGHCIGEGTMVVERPVGRAGFGVWCAIASPAALTGGSERHGIWGDVAAQFRALADRIFLAVAPPASLLTCPG